MRLLAISLLLFYSSCIRAQNMDTRSMSTRENNISQNFSVLTKEAHFKPKNDLIYTYFRDEKLFQTQGSFSGWLLQGKYESFYADKMLQSQGEYKNGLKNGEWKYWYPNGFLKVVETWKNGYKTGAFQEYNDKGVLVKSGNYSDSFITGKVLVYNDKKEVIEVLTFKKGVSQQPKTKKVAIVAIENK